MFVRGPARGTSIAHPIFCFPLRPGKFFSRSLCEGINLEFNSDDVFLHVQFIVLLHADDTEIPTQPNPASEHH